MRRIVSTVLIFVFATFVSPMPVAFAQGQQGGVNGTAVDASKNPLANHTVRLRNVKTGQITSVTQSATDGAFNFAGINPGDYVIEIVNSSNSVIATSSTIAVSAGTTATVTVTASAITGLAGAAGAGGLAGLFTGTSLVVVTAAGVAGVVIAVNAINDDSPSR